jgi:hypothetical protein
VGHLFALRLPFQWVGQRRISAFSQAIRGPIDVSVIHRFQPACQLSYNFPACERWILLLPDITQTLNAIEEGDPSAADQVLPIVYGEFAVLREEAEARLLDAVYPDARLPSNWQVTQ